MKYSYSFFLLMLLAPFLSAQPWIDTLFSIETSVDLPYGSATDFAGNARELRMDISQPLGDTPPPCGRPLMILVHGGAFIAGDKTDGSMQRMRIDFAKRGYVTASVTYRLGQFQTHQAINCNISALGVEWNCLNMADTSEWYRAYYRGIQDVHGAIRFLVNHADDYKIDPQHIFVVGESAGAFIAMGTGYIDDPSEVLTSLTGSFVDIQPPNSIYEMRCVQGYGLDTSIASMDLRRPDLGDYAGSLNQPAATPYRIRGIGNFFGAVFNNIFASTKTDIPALYSYHQPNDLIVPFGRNKIFAGFAYCATQWPFSCQYIVNRPIVHGSDGIKDILADMTANNIPVPEAQFDHSNNTANCAQQIANPALGGHAIDNYALRTKNMAVFFAGKIDSCTAMDVPDAFLHQSRFSLSPNPLPPSSVLRITGDFWQNDRIELITAGGMHVGEFMIENPTHIAELDLREKGLAEGLYFVRIRHRNGVSIRKLVLQN